MTLLTQSKRITDDEALALIRDEHVVSYAVFPAGFSVWLDDGVESKLTYWEGSEDHSHEWEITP